ncbi:unnamed protein product [Sphagnum tenellum]
MKTIWYVHGAGASSKSFVWLKTQLPRHRTRLFEYALGESLQDCIERLSIDVTSHGEPGIVIGHSLGGLIASGVVNQPNINGLVTICTPFGGLAVAMFLKMLKSDQLFRDLSPLNPALRAIRKGVVASGKPHLAIVGTSGLPYSNEVNDGVVSLDSQTAIEGCPGSGKSTWRDAYMSHAQNPTVVISSDDLIEAWGKQRGLNYSEAFKQVDFSSIERQLMADFRSALNHNKDIIVDRTNLKRKSRKGFMRMIPDTYETCAVVFDVPREELQRRLDARAKATGKHIPTQVVDDMIATAMPPEPGEFDRIEKGS